MMKMKILLQEEGRRKCKYSKKKQKKIFSCNFPFSIFTYDTDITIVNIDTYT